MGAPPSAIDRRPARNLTATTRSPPGFGRRPRRLRRGPVRHRRRRREAKSGEDWGACGKDRFATRRRRREAKRGEDRGAYGEDQFVTRRRRREAERGEDRGAYGEDQGADCELEELFESSLKLGCNLPDDVKIRLYPGNIPGI